MSKFILDEAGLSKILVTNMGNKVIQNVVTQIEKCERDENNERVRQEEESNSDQENINSQSDSSVSENLKLSSSSSASTSSVGPKSVLTPSNKKDDSGYLQTGSSDSLSSQLTPSSSRTRNMLNDDATVISILSSSSASTSASSSPTKSPEKCAKKSENNSDPVVTKSCKYAPFSISSITITRSNETSNTTPQNRKKSVLDQDVSPLSAPSAGFGTSIIFNNNNTKFMSEFQIPARLEYILDMPMASFEVASMHAWNPDDRSLNIFVKETDPFTLHRHPVAQSTDCIRTKIGYTKGIHLWELNWNSRQRGTHAIIGVATDKSPLHCVGYQSLIGSNPESWGWDLGRNRACHNTKATNHPPPIYPKMLKQDEVFVVPDKFMMCLDMDEGTLSFLADGQYLGVAFRGLKGKKVHPIVSAVWGHCEITMRYVNGMDPNPLPLTDLCRRTIRQSVGKSRLNEIKKLNLPNSIKNFLLFKN